MGTVGDIEGAGEEVAVVDGAVDSVEVSAGEEVAGSVKVVVIGSNGVGEGEGTSETAGVLMVLSGAG